MDAGAAGFEILLGLKTASFSEGRLTGFAFGRAKLELTSGRLAGAAGFDLSV